MAAVSRATRVPVALYHTVGSAGKSGFKARRASDSSLTTPGLDLATRLRTLQRALRGRVERREALIDIVRAVNATLEPPQIAELIVERAESWLPAPVWAVVVSTTPGELQILANRGLTTSMGPAVHAIARWVMDRGEDFASADLGRDTRISDPAAGAALGFVLSCRARRVGA